MDAMSLPDSPAQLDSQAISLRPSAALSKKPASSLSPRTEWRRGEIEKVEAETLTRDGRGHRRTALLELFHRPVNLKFVPFKLVKSVY